MNVICMMCGQDAIIRDIEEDTHMKNTENLENTGLSGSTANHVIAGHNMVTKSNQQDEHTCGNCLLSGCYGEIDGEDGPAPATNCKYWTGKY